MSDDATLNEFVKDTSHYLDLGPRSLDLPDQWSKTEFRNTFSYQRGVNYSSDNYVSEGEGMVFLTMNAIAPGGGLKKDSLKFYDDDIPDSKTTTEGDILMANTDLSQDGEIIGYPVRVPAFDTCVDKCFSHHLLKIQQTQRRYDSHFLEYLLSAKYIHDRMIAFSCGSTVLNLNTDLLESLEIPVPPLSEQRKVATVLHTVDQAIQKTEEIIEQARLVRDGLRQTVFTVGINSRGQPRELSDEELQKTRIGEIPSIWDFSRLDEVCSDVVDCLNTTPEYSDDGIRVVLTSEIEEGRYNPDESPYVTEEVYRERIRRIEPRAGDVIFTREAPIGEAFKIPEGERLCLGQRTMQLRVKSGVLDSDYLLEALYSEKMQGWYQRVAVGSTTKHVRVEDVEGMKIPVPEIDEQRKIASLLGSYRSYIEASLHYTDKLRNLKQGLMQDLLSGKVRITDANIEIPEEVAQYG
jgi:type I restriction enzyme S subunit